MIEPSAQFIIGDCLVTVLGKQEEHIKLVCRLFKMVRQPAAGNRAGLKGGTPDYDKQICLTIDLEAEVVEYGQSLAELLSFQPALALRYVLNSAYQHQQSLLWLDAAALAGAGGPILLAGPSFSGKTTLALGLALSANFQVISEDITFLDTTCLRIVPVVAPFSLRAGTLERLSKCADTDALVGLTGDLLNMQGKFVDAAVKQLFKHVFVLEKINTDSQDDFSFQAISREQLLRKVLSSSNILRIAGGVAAFERFLPGSSLWAISGGEVEDRLPAILRVVT